MQTERKLRTLIDKLTEVATGAPPPPVQAVVEVAPRTPLSDAAMLAPRLEMFGVEVIDLIAEERPYWGEIPREQLHEILTEASVSGVSPTLMKKLPAIGKEHLIGYILDVGRRSAWTTIFGDLSGSVAVDVGAGYGANTIALSKRFETVIATDAILERLVLLGLRLKELGITNVILVRTEFERCPIKNAAADFICCNGVMEWVGTSAKSGNVEELQQQIIAAFTRSLSENGQLYIGIENRYGLAALAGTRDHSGLRYTSLLPRWLASICVWFNNAFGGNAASYVGMSRYRTYTHSARRWRKLLTPIGLEFVEIWGTNDYNNPQFCHSLGDRNSKRAIAAVRKSSPRSNFANRLINYFSWKAPSCFLIRASRRPQPGVFDTISSAVNEFELNGNPALLDLRSADSGEIRFIFGNGSDGLTVLKRRAAESNGVRSARRVFITQDGACSEHTQPKYVMNETAFSVEAFRDPASLLHAIPPKKGWERAAMASLKVWGKHLLSHLAHDVRCWTQDDSERLLLAPLARIRAEIGNEAWPMTGVVEKLASSLNGKTLRFGATHGDLTPENLFPADGGVVVEDWNDSLPECPVGVDACMFAWAVASKRKDKTYFKRLEKCLSELQEFLLPGAFESRHALLAIAILNWRGLHDCARAIPASKHAAETLIHLVDQID